MAWYRAGYDGPIEVELMGELRADGLRGERFHRGISSYPTIDDPAHQQEINRLRQAMEDWMVRTGDHALEAFRHRDDNSVVEAYMHRVQDEAAARRKRKKRG